MCVFVLCTRVDWLYLSLVFKSTEVKLQANLVSDHSRHSPGCFCVYRTGYLGRGGEAYGVLSDIVLMAGSLWQGFS